MTPTPVECLDALYLLGLGMHALCTYLLTYLHSCLWAYKTGNIFETVEDKAKVTIKGLGLYNIVQTFGCRQNV